MKGTQVADDFDWTEFEGDRFSFDNVGDKIAGRIRELTVKTGQSGKYPVLTLQVDKEGNTREVNGGSTDLKQQLAAIRPQIGWWVEITYTGTRQTGQPSPMKLFDVKVKQPKPEAVVEPEPVAVFDDPDLAPFAEEPWDGETPI